ncbi:MAG TPA: helix-turn-helix transcriptional regulator [Candidatus Coprocola pullicola]|nr:helix-turn-helix transcriptional regulator [Candidatus Coprocola pullicola]
MEYKGYQLKIALKELLEQKNMTRYALAEATERQFKTIDRYYKNKLVKFDGELLLRICVELDCNIEDILKIEKIK